jgi:hypothetical protein
MFVMMPSGNREELSVKEILFLGGPADGKRAFVEPVPYIRWPVSVDSCASVAICSEATVPLMEKDDWVEYKRITMGDFDVMFFDEGINPLKKLIDGYKA